MDFIQKLLIDSGELLLADLTKVRAANNERLNQALLQPVICPFDPISELGEPDRTPYCQTK